MVLGDVVIVSRIEKEYNVWSLGAENLSFIVGLAVKIRISLFRSFQRAIKIEGMGVWNCIGNMNL